MSTTQAAMSVDDLATLPTGSRDAVGSIVDQNATRLPTLVPVCIGRMLQSPFAYYRGTAACMAADLAMTPHSNVIVMSCGDAHISNFGFYASQSARSSLISTTSTRAASPHGNGILSAS